MKILFFSDWRIQPLSLIEKALDRLGPFDLIVYGGNDLRRFLPEPDISQELLDTARQKCKYIDPFKIII